MNIIKDIEAEQISEIIKKRDVPDFKSGDAVRVNVFVTEGNKERVQAFEGICIARSNRGFNSTFTVRKVSHGEGVERVFPLYSPMLESIKLIRRGKVKRSKLYYLRQRSGKSARIAEKKDFIKKNIGVEVTVQEESPQTQETKSVEINENIKSKDKEVKKDKDLKAKTTEKKVDPKELKK